MVEYVSNDSSSDNSCAQNNNDSCKFKSILEESKEIRKTIVHPDQFVYSHPKFIIPGYCKHIHEDDQITVLEYAPRLFRCIRNNIVSEDQLLQTFMPSKNCRGMYNFKIGSGKSPSFFFFPDNKLLMLKTVKPSEMQILFKKGFFLAYFKFIM